MTALRTELTPGQRRRRRREFLTAMAFVLPAAIGFMAFYLAPTIRGIYISLTDYNLMSTPSFIGLRNYVRLMSDPLFLNSVVVTLEYVVINIAVQTVVAVGLAVLMHRLTRSVVIRGTILLPFLVSNVIAAMVWFLLLDFQLGLVNSAIEALGLTRIPFFADDTWAIPTIALVNVWRHAGYTALLVFAGLQMIPPYVYEAAALDGSSEWRTFWKITLPLLRPVLALVLVITVTGSFQVFDTVAVTTRGGPINATRVIQYYIYQVGFGENDFGYASAISVVLLLILAVVAFFQLRMMRANQSDLA
ncbi:MULTISPECIES: carbohydrate ABC transporter permease [Microbacterium]|uniref:carbohydrate ABC transporter permease n=1 Tax=Microbacterium TaxID=33882 RepID=UPI0027862102|nr:MULTISPECIES: sugar ABC transporter permease [Microbacterium]MDQ1085217.1 multiple sugar transport system permease protein [Microbacterium sp. SORGH_AS_0344]MDQ1169477.1 multiple sugar transport system permease protein [Microbacterium proteolyticum]